MRNFPASTSDCLHLKHCPRFATAQADHGLWTQIWDYARIVFLMRGVRDENKALNQHKIHIWTSLQEWGQVSGKPDVSTEDEERGHGEGNMFASKNKIVTLAYY